MRTLRLNTRGEDVKAWEHFLRGQDFYWIEVDGFFDPETEEATKAFQREHFLLDDGVVGTKTYAAAMSIGFSLLEDDLGGDGWPSLPKFKPIPYNDRFKIFGNFKFMPAGRTNNPEAITILDGWYGKNIVSTKIPQLENVQGTAGRSIFEFNKLVGAQIKGFFEAVEKLGKLHLILTWGGSYAPRFVRGSRTYLSNHSFGSAFDINVPWNGLGVNPAPRGQKGSVIELVDIAHKFGLYWGGHFKRKDGMHFEVAEIMSDEKVKEVLESL